MPIHEYYCCTCKRTVDILENVQSEPLKYHCEQCKTLLTKQVSAGIMNLKGKGFYKGGIS